MFWSQKLSRDLIFCCHQMISLWKGGQSWPPLCFLPCKPRACVRAWLCSFFRQLLSRSLLASCFLPSLPCLYHCLAHLAPLSSSLAWYCTSSAFSVSSPSATPIRALRIERSGCYMPPRSTPQLMGSVGLYDVRGTGRNLVTPIAGLFHGLYHDCLGNGTS